MNRKKLKMNIEAKKTSHALIEDYYLYNIVLKQKVILNKYDSLD